MIRSVRKALLSLGIVVPLMVTAAVQAQASTLHVVRPGDSVQAALDAARPGDTVLVKAGVYHENVEITTDDITLVGQGAILEPPQTPTPRRCSTSSGQASNEFGLCVTGLLGPRMPGHPAPVIRPVRDVTIRGMIVHQYPSTGIVTIGAENVRIEDTEAVGGADYGILLSETTGGTVVDDRVTGGDEAGVYVGDSPGAHTVVRDNAISDSGVFAVFLRDSSRGVVTGNHITTSCVGVGLVPTTPDAGAVSNWVIARNDISDNDQVCPPPDEGGPTLTGIGVLMAGTSRVAVVRNTITDNRPAPGTTPQWSGGVVLVSAAAFGGPTAPTDNLVAHNVLHGNQAFDLNVVDQGVGNRFRANDCDTGSSPGLC